MRSKKALKNMTTSLMLQLVTIICGFIVPRLIIQAFGSNVNGLINSITQFLSYITLLDSGVGQVIKATLYKPIAQKDKHQITNILMASEKFFQTIAYILLVYIVVLCAIFPLIMNGQFDTMYTLSLVVIISISTFAEYYLGMTYKVFLQAEQKSYITSIIQIGTVILNTIMVVILINCNANIQIVKLVSAIVFIARPILQNIYVKKKYNLNLKEADKGFKLKQKWDGFAQHIASVIHNNTDVAILTLFSNVAEVSVYSVHMLVVNGIKKLVEAIMGGIDAAFGDMIARDEKDNLNRSFRVYELFFLSIITILFIVTLIMIVPFVKVYTDGITDANYNRPIFAYIMVIAELIYVIRLPYSSLTNAAGKFKETRNGALAEAGINIIVSLLLVWKLGITGVAIGTLLAMIVRTIEFLIFTSKHILHRKITIVVRRMLIIVVEFAIMLFISHFINLNRIDSYQSWIIYAIIITVITIILCMGINLIVYRKDAKELLNIIKRNFKKEEK